MVNFIKERILSYLKKEPLKEFSTTDIIAVAYPTQFRELKNAVDNLINDKEIQKESKRQMAKLHRKVLYHLNLLLEENRIIQTRISNNREKFFVINDLSVPYSEDNKKSEKMSLISLLSFSKYGDIELVDKEGWLERINSVLIDCNQVPNIESLIKIVLNIKDSVNDCIAIYRFDKLIPDNSNQKTIEKMANSLINMISRITTYDIKINLLIDLNLITNYDILVMFFKTLFENYNNENDGLKIVIELNNQIVHNNEKLIRLLYKLFQQYNQNLYLKNGIKNITPFFVGKYGAYSYDAHKWRVFQTENGHKIKLLICSSNTIIVDFGKFFDKGNRQSDLRGLVIDINKSLLQSTFAQNMKSEQYIKEMLRINYPYIIETKVLSSNFLRFYNFYTTDKEKLEINLSLLESIKQIITKFSNTERTIYKSSGIPLVFSLLISSFASDEAKITLDNENDFSKENIKNKLEFKQKVSQIFTGGSILRFESKYSSQEVIRQLMYMLNYYQIPFVELCLGKSKFERNLNDFIK